LAADDTDLSGEYFTSGSDNKVEKSYVWCSANKAAVSYTSWTDGEPSDVGGTENCLTYTAIHKNVAEKDVTLEVDIITQQDVANALILANVGTLADKSCTSSLKYICEVYIIK
jgi:hypothetical protein